MLPLRHERRPTIRNKISLTSTSSRHLPRSLTRYTRLVIILGILTLGLVALRNVRAKTREKYIQKEFEQIRNYERSLPQNSLYHPKRMVKFSNEVWGLGLNNQLNNRLMLSHLAYISKRAYVFQDVMFGDTWGINPWYPLNTFISGPTAGGPFPRGIMAPRSISAESWERHCPIKERTLLNVSVVNEELGIVHDVTEGLSVLKKWGEKLLTMTDYFGSPKSLQLWPIFSTSPAITGFQWSNTVLNAVKRNTPLITGRVVEPNYNMENVLALHLRRGDFEPHCTHMTKYASGYNSWNLLSELPDKYIPPDSSSIEDPHDVEIFMRHCWPSIEDVVRRVGQVKNDYDAIGGLPPLDAIYILTNGDKPWVTALKQSIRQSSPVWKRVTSSHDLSLKNGPEKLAAQAVDMAIASQTGSLIGNGFSTLTANVVMFRLLDGKHPQTCRMW
ncbi:hypothetical protein Clacol_007735 [Clathrus columnatus]|uniref:Uncharacterized protein n=1 Tax=Clathrus columnatus TaxID=1419009 RepID=A0AAV5AKL0_9AGAM|nr:hypothetical protein Clacol_007735 [Clathrus columnatus]